MKLVMEAPLDDGYVEIDGFREPRPRFGFHKSKHHQFVDQRDCNLAFEQLLERCDRRTTSGECDNTGIAALVQSKTLR
jgi:hypothetical protein